MAAASGTVYLFYKLKKKKDKRKNTYHVFRPNSDELDFPHQGTEPVLTKYTGSMDELRSDDEETEQLPKQSFLNESDEKNRKTKTL